MIGNKRMSLRGLWYTIPLRSIIRCLLRHRFSVAVLFFSSMLPGITDLPAQTLTLPLEQRPEWLRREGLIMGGNWHALPFRTHVGTHLGRLPTEEERANWELEHSPAFTQAMKDLGVNFIMMHCYHGAGLEVEKESMEDAVRFAKQYHDAGLHVGVYVYSGAFHWEPMFRLVPEAQNWIVLDRNYQPFQYYNAGIRYFWNRNHPGAQAYYRKIVDFAVNEIQADMLHFDNFHAGPGRDAYSIERFREYLRNTFTLGELEQMGAADLSRVLPPMGTRSSTPTYRVNPMDGPPRTQLDYAWLEFTAQSLADGYSDMGRYARTLRSDILLELNCGGAGDRIQPPVDHGRLLQGGEAQWAEGSPSGYTDGVYRTRIKSYKIARSMNNLVFYYAATPLSMAESMAFNSDCLGMICQFRNGAIRRVPESSLEPVSDEIKPYVQFYRTRRTLFREAQVLADVAVLRSFSSQMFADPEFARLTFQVEQHCIDARLPFQIVHDHQLGALDQYRVLVLAGCIALSDMQIQQILRFVDRGGRLCVIGPVGTHTEWMKPREGDILQNVPADRVVRIVDGGNIGDALRQAAGGQFSAGVEGPEGVFVEYTMTPEGRLVHLVNFRPELPAGDVQVNVRVPEGRKVKRVLLASPDQKIAQPVKFTKKGDRIFFVVPEVNTYTVAIVEM